MARMVGKFQDGFRCDVLSESGKAMGMAQARQVAARYRGAEVLHDIDVCTGEAVYRVYLPADSVVEMASTIKRRRRNV